MNPTLALTAVALAGLIATLPWRCGALALSRAKHPSLTGHSRMAKRVAGWLPGYAYDDGGLLRLRRRAGRSRRAPPRRRLEALAMLFQRALRRHARATQAPRPACPTCSSPAPTACPSSTARVVREHLRVGAFLQSSSGVTVDRPRWQRLLRPDRLLRRQRVRLRLLQGVHRRGRLARAALGPVLGAYHPCVASNVERLKRDLWAGRGLVPHVRHRGGDAGGAPGALPHAAQATWCASAARTTAGGRTCSPAPATRCRRARPTRCATWTSARCTCCARGATSPACWSTRCRRCTRTATRPATRRWSTAAASAHFDRAAYTEWLKASCALSAPSAASC